MLVFGPVPSRRLGQSLGVNNIPSPKQCPYDCIYCQVGATPQRSVHRRSFYAPHTIAEEVARRLEECRAAGASVDYVTFVPDGEPTLDVNLGESIKLLRPLGCKIAIITNATLIDREDVRNELLCADWVSLKVDSVDPRTWRAVNRPHPDLQLDALLDGMRAFAEAFAGELTTETLLVRDLNDSVDCVESVAAFVHELQPAVAYIAATTRPPAEPWVRAPEEAALNRAHQIFGSYLDTVEYLLGYAEEPFHATSDPAQAILSITAVHPMREEEALDYVEQMGAESTVLSDLVQSGQLTCIPYEGHRFYVRRVTPVTN